MAIIPRRGVPETWYPAGVPDVAARYLPLSHGERVRVVETQLQKPAPAVLLLHGWGCNAFHFRHVLPALTRRGLYAVAVDLRGHGLSDKPPDESAYSSQRLVQFIEGVLDALGLQRAGIVGHSLGAAIAIDVTLAVPQRVSWLTLLNPVGLAQIAGSRIIKRLPVQIAERPPTAVSRLMGWMALHTAYGRLAKPAPGDLEQYAYPTLLPGGRFGALAYARAFQWDARGAEMLQRITCPLHVMVGDRDRVVAATAIKQALGPIRHARIDVIAGAGHVLAEEVPELVADAIAQSAAASERLTTQHSA
jgi:pimeloyl-ACP methyl ester carboxylesterase